MISRLIAAALLLPAAAIAAEPVKKDAERPAYESLSIRGRVVWLADALEELHGIKTVPEAHERSLVLVTPEGRLHPLVEDNRGRAFRSDKRLRNIDVELVVRRYKGSPLVQVVRVFHHKNDGKYEVDYWCDICAIAMFELKDCDCCQGPIELRERKVK